MRKPLVLLFFVCFLTHFAHAQKNGAALLQQAANTLNHYQTDSLPNPDSLQKAILLIDQAFHFAELQSNGSAWMLRGEIYNARLEQDLSTQQYSLDHPWSGENDALEVFNAYQKGYQLQKDTNDKAIALQMIAATQGPLINMGVLKYNAGAYEKAFFSFQAALESHELLKANRLQSLLDEQTPYLDMVFSTAVAAQAALRQEDAMRYFEMLYNAGAQYPAAYESLYHLKLENGDVAAADKILKDGRQKFPADSGLLFAEINDLIKKGELETLGTRLRQAIAQEPDNIQLYVTIGNVYDHLFQQFIKANNASKAEDYFNLARKYYLEAQAKDPNNLDAFYSLGSLYYNKAAFRTQEMNAMPEDRTATGMNRLAKMGAEIMALFDQALPCFQRAESLDPNDLNTLLALSEIYARKEEEQLSETFKVRLERVKSGGKNAQSYFKQ